MTTITASSYSPNGPAQPLTPLTGAQVDLLKQGKTYDVSQKVKTVVQRHLGYQGTDEFRAHFTNQQITFTLKNGNAAESRILKFENSHWMLSQHTAPATAIDEALGNEINTLITDILSKIGQASQTNTPNSAPAAEPAADVDGAARPANTVELADVRARLDILEAQLRANPNLEQILRIQEEILREIIRLREALERQPNTAERDALRSQVRELQRTCANVVELRKRCLTAVKEQADQKEAAETRNKALEAELKIIEQRLQNMQQEMQQARPTEAAAATLTTNASCQKTIPELEKRVPSTPEASRPSAAALSPTTLDQRHQIQLLRSQVEQVKEGQISAEDREGALQNYIFLLFVQEKNGSVDLATFNPTNLSAEDQKLLKAVAQRTLQMMDPNSTSDDLESFFKSFFKSKKRNIDRKIQSVALLQKSFGETDIGIAQLEGKAREIFSRFFYLITAKASSKEKNNYGDFIFARIPFLAAELLLIEKIYEKCRAYYEKTRDRNDPQFVMINEKIRQIKEVQELFLTLLQNCKVS